MRCNVDVQLLDRVISAATLAAVKQKCGSESQKINAEKLLCTAVASLFADANDTAYYITDYVNKSGPTMEDSVFPKLAEGIARLRDELADKQGLTKKQIAARTVFRLQSSSNKASHKSGCEMAYQLCCANEAIEKHEWWTLFTKYLVFKAQQSWRK